MSGTIATLQTETLVSLDEAQRMVENLLMRLPNNEAFLNQLVNKLAERGIKACDGGCSINAESPCTIDTRLSHSRMLNLQRQDGDEFGFTDNMPIQPQQAVEYTIPAFPLGRVIELFYFRPTMGAGGNPDDLRISISGEDGVLWKKFRGGRHNASPNGCCLLECFANDCIGWDEGFKVTIEHTGPVGSPPLLSAVADWNYLFPGSKSNAMPNWCWPRNCKK